MPQTPHQQVAAQRVAAWLAHHAFHQAWLVTNAKIDPGTAGDGPWPPGFAATIAARSGVSLGSESGASKGYLGAKQQQGYSQPGSRCSRSGSRVKRVPHK